jgi:urease accessory protein UreH
MKKTEILNTENCVELINGLLLLIRHCETGIDKAQDEDARQKWFDRMENAKELERAISALVNHRLIRRVYAEDRQRAKEYAARASQAAMERLAKKENK